MLANHFHEQTVRDASITLLPLHCVHYSGFNALYAVCGVDTLHRVNRTALKTTSWRCRGPLATLVGFPADGFDGNPDSKLVVRGLFWDDVDGGVIECWRFGNCTIARIPA